MKFQKILTIGIDEAKLDPVYWKRLDSLAEKRVNVPKDSPDIKNQLADTDCLLVNFGVAVGKEEIDSAPKLKYVGALATAFGKIDSDYAKTKGITVCNIPGYSTESVAEFVFAAILENIRELEKGKKQAREKNYSESGFSATEIKGKQFGVLGLGRIGGRVSEIAIGFGANVSYYSRNRKKDFEAKGIKYEEMSALMPKCDFLTIHFAQTKETEGFMNDDFFKKIKKGAVVVNTAPMDIVDIDALERKLKIEDMTFILDHSDEMSEDNLRKISGYKNCVIYPPIAYISKEATVAKKEIFVSNIENFLKGASSNAVN